MNNELFIWLVIIGLIIPFISTFTLNYWISSKNKWIWINWITSTILILISAGLTILFTCLLNDNLAIILSAFYSGVVWMGGSGAVLGLTIVALIFSKSKQNKAITKTAFVPSLFNISEPILFGYPIILNIYLLLPFILAPIFCTIVGGLLSSWLHVAWVVNAPWSLPVPLYVFLATMGNWKSEIIVFICLAVACLTYLPFYKIYDNVMFKQEREATIKEAESLGISMRELLIEKEKKNLKTKKHFWTRKIELIKK